MMVAVVVAAAAVMVLEPTPSIALAVCQDIYQFISCSLQPCEVLAILIPCCNNSQRGT